MPSDVYVTLTATSWGDWNDSDRWVAPADGYIVISHPKSATIPLYLQSENSVACIGITTTYGTTYIPIMKGKKARWDNSTSATFYYTVGEAKRLGLL